jgi:hypothetical protein
MQFEGRGIMYRKTRRREDSGNAACADAASNPSTAIRDPGTLGALIGKVSLRLRRRVPNASEVAKARCGFRAAGRSNESTPVVRKCIACDSRVDHTVTASPHSDQ